MNWVDGRMDDDLDDCDERGRRVSIHGQANSVASYLRRFFFFFCLFLFCSRGGAQLVKNKERINEVTTIETAE